MLVENSELVLSVAAIAVKIKIFFLIFFKLVMIFIQIYFFV